MVCLLFGKESTVFSLVCQKAQTRLSSLSYCPSVSSVLCFLAPEFPTALEPFWIFVYFFLPTCAIHSLHHALLCLWNSAHLLRPSFFVTLNEKTSLLPLLPLGPSALWTSVLTLTVLSACLPVCLFHWAAKKGETGDQRQCAKEVCWCFFPSGTVKCLLRWIATSMWN